MKIITTAQQQNFSIIRKNLDGTTMAFAECCRKFKGLLFPMTWLTRFFISSISWKSSSNSLTADTWPEGPTHIYPRCPFKNLLILCSNFKSPATDEKSACCHLSQQKSPEQISHTRKHVCAAVLVFFKIKWIKW